MEVPVEHDDPLEALGDEAVDDRPGAAAGAEHDGLAGHLLLADELVERDLEPGHVGVVPDEALALARDRVDRAGRVGLLGQAVDHGHDPLLVRDRDVRAEEVVGAQLGDGVGQRRSGRGPTARRSASMPSESNAACCIAPDSEWATGWPMRTTRFVMLAPFRGRRRSRDRRSPPTPGRPTVVAPEATSPAIAKVMASRWSSRLSVAAPSRRAPPSIAQVVAVDLDPGAQGAQAGRHAGDPVGFLVAELAGATDRRRAVGAGPPPGTGPGSRRSPRRRRPGRGRCRGARTSARPGRRRGSPTSSAAGRRRSARSSMSAPMRRSRSMTARRVGLTPTSRRVSSASGWIAAGDQPEGGRGHVARDPLIDRLHRHPSLHRPRTAPSVRRRARPPRPARGASVPCGRGSPPTRGPSSDHPPGGPPAGSPTSPARSGPAWCSRWPRAG